MASKLNLTDLAIQVSERDNRWIQTEKGVYKKKGDNAGQHYRQSPISAPAACLPQESLFPQRRKFASASVIHYCRAANIFPLLKDKNVYTM